MPNIRNIVSRTVDEILESTGCILKGHFVLKSASAFSAEARTTPPGKGDHSNTYVDKDRISLTDEIERIGALMAFLMFSSRLHAQVIACPAIGAISFRDAVARHLSFLTREPLERVYTEKDESGVQAFRRSNYADVVRDKRVIVVEDIATTGGSLFGVKKAVMESGGTPVAAGVIVARGGLTASSLAVDVLHVLYQLHDIPKWPADECPLCRDGIPRINTDVGHGRDFLRLQEEKAKRGRGK